MDRYLTREGETIQEAKERLNKEQAERKDIRMERKQQHNKKVKKYNH